MDFDRMEYLGVVVDDLEVGVQRFADLFGLEFEIIDTRSLNQEASDGVIPDARAPQGGMRVALDLSGSIELVEAAGLEEGFRNIHFRVDDIESAINHLSNRGLRLVRRFVVGRMMEAIFAAEDLYGIRVCLLQYEGTSLAEAMRWGSSEPS